MKKLTILIALFFSVNCYSQKPDSASAPIPDSIEFISKRHVAQARRNLDEALRKMEDQLTVSQYRKLTEGIEAAFGEIINVAEQDYRKKVKRK